MLLFVHLGPTPISWIRLCVRLVTLYTGDFDPELTGPEYSFIKKKDFFSQALVKVKNFLDER